MELTCAADMHLKPKLQEKEFSIESDKVQKIADGKSIQVGSNVFENIKEYGDCPTMNKVDIEYPQSTSSRNDLELHTDFKHKTVKKVFQLDKPEKKSGLYKILKWDPWQRNSNKNKKKKDKKKSNIEAALECIDVREAPKHYYPNSKYPPVPQKCGLKLSPRLEREQDQDSLDSYNDYSIKKKMAGKTVKFQNEVVVFHFTNDQVIEQSIEPLKKELEQQERNKKLRNDVNQPETFTGIKSHSKRGYMSHWFKK